MTVLLACWTFLLLVRVALQLRASRRHKDVRHMYYIVI
jgi:hypothetical protein